MTDTSHPDPGAVVAHAPAIGRDGLCIACRSPLMTGWHVAETDEREQLGVMVGQSLGAIIGEVLALRTYLQRLGVLGVES